jgi:hypothetical protein
MGGAIESHIEPKAERLLAWIWPGFKDRNEIKAGVNHFLKYVWLTGSLSVVGLKFGWVSWAAVASIILVVVDEWGSQGRWVDRITRSIGWAYGLAPTIFKLVWP